MNFIRQKKKAAKGLASFPYVPMLETLNKISPETIGQNCKWFGRTGYKVTLYKSS